jgi:hypothetical protein
MASLTDANGNSNCMLLLESTACASGCMPDDDQHKAALLTAAFLCKLLIAQCYLPLAALTGSVLHLSGL